MSDYNQLILDNLARGAAKEGEIRANVGNPNQRLVWRNGQWEDAGKAADGTNQLILDNLARGAAKEGEIRANVSNPNQRLMWSKGEWRDAGTSGAMSEPKPAVQYSTKDAGVKPAAGAMSQPRGGTVDASYRTPLQSRLEGLANPFGENYQQRLAGQGISNAEQQYRQAADRTRSMLASRGLMSGGGTGLQASLMNQAAMDAAGARERALTGAATDTATRAADFEFRRAGAIDAYNRGLMSDAQALSLLPSQVALTQAQAQQAGTNARLADATFGNNVGLSNASLRQANADADLAGGTVDARKRLANSQADQAAIANDIAKLDYSTRQQLQENVLARAKNELALSDAEVQSARRFMNETDPNQWWNWSGWKGVKGLLDFVKTGSEVYRNVKS